MFDHLQASIFPLGYRLGESGRRGRGSNTVRKRTTISAENSVYHPWQNRKRRKGESWINYVVASTRGNRTNIEVQTAKPAPVREKRTFSYVLCKIIWKLKSGRDYTATDIASLISIIKGSKVGQDFVAVSLDAD